MCGIAGLATVDGLLPEDRALVDRMLISLAHRGPDDQHVDGDDRALVGARRLSIIDVEGSRQPLTNETGEIVASQNGEIYNYLELRDELLNRGHVLRTQGDTETIVHLYEEDGPDFVKRLRGMFAVAIWDSRRQRLVLARDRLGKKPLYWRLSNGRLSYGSELKAILADDDLPRTVDREALGLFLQYQYVPAPLTILEGVHKLPPASVLVWDGGVPQISRYWSPQYGPKTGQSIDEDVEQGLSILRESVRIRLRSDVPVGVFLSGGMDSSVVTALMAEASARPVQTFSIGFENQAFDELPFARAVAERFSTTHTEETVRIDALEMLPAIAEHYDEPFADYSSIPTLRVSQIAGAHLKVVLTGDGGDESFGGYVRYRTQQSLNHLDRIPTGLLRLTARAGRLSTSRLGNSSRLRHRFGRLDELVRLTSDQRYVSLMTIIGEPSISRLLGRDRESSPETYLLDVLRRGPVDSVDRLLRADLLSYLPEDLLVKVDRATMAASLEARSPLLDQELVAFAARLPSDRKIQGGTSKVLLRLIAKRLMPASMVDRPKMGFGVPMHDWFRAALGPRFRELVLAPDARSRDHLDVSVASAWLSEHESGAVDHSHRLWALLVYELWARRWLRPRDRV